MDQSFPTWSFDNPCLAMEWTKMTEATLTVESADQLADATANANLVVIGVMAPAKDDDDADSDDEEESDQDVPVTLTGMAAELDQEMGGALSAFLMENSKTFQGGAKMGSTTPTLRLVAADGSGTVSTKRYIVIGLGATPAKDAKDPLAGAGAALGKAVAAKCHAEKKVASCKVILPAAMLSDATVLTDFATQFYQSLYADNRYRTGKKVKIPAQDLKSVTLVAVDGAVDAAVVDAAISAGKKLAQGVFLCKDIVNAPHNVLNSVSLAETAKRIAADSGGRIKCQILDKKECEKRGMGAYLGVARGSETEPQFIHLTYKPASGEIVKKVGIVGKGLLFDTGGYNIKTQMMELMKFDCGGAAAVLGAAQAVGALAPAGVEAHFIVAACENMINEKAMVASDILTAMNGKTIEVMNTDAEGRLTLADALVFADKEVGCESIIELSTLTGACMVSLGKGLCGVWTSNDDLAKELEDISKVTGDKSWRMPLPKEYNDQIESKFADLKNVGTRYGGAITAALFLQHFVEKKKPFAHIDIAGPVWSDKIGATGFGTKLVTEWISRQGIKKE
jgi:leucyl aminopeptidase